MATILFPLIDDATYIRLAAIGRDLFGPNAHLQSCLCDIEEYGRKFACDFEAFDRSHLSESVARRVKRKYEPTPEIDQLLRSTIRKGVAVGSGVLRDLASQTGWSPRGIVRRARELKLYRPKKTRQWTPDNLTLLHDACAAGLTDEEIQARLRERFTEEWTLSAIKAKRQKIGLVAAGADLSELLSRRNRKYWPTPEIDEIIRRCFGRKYQDGGALANASRETGWPKNAVIGRARELGLSHARNEVRWTDAEERLLEELAHQSPQTIQVHLKERCGVHRTLTSIEAKRQRLGLLSNLDGMNLRQLAEALGVATKTVDRWLAGGWIRGVLRFPELQAVNRHVWFFPNTEIRRFIVEHLEAVDLARVEKFWFVDLLTNGEA